MNPDHDLLGHRVVSDQVFGGEWVDGKFTDCEERAADGKRMYDRVDAGAIWKAGIHHWRRLIDATAYLADDFFDDSLEVGLVDEPGVGSAQQAGALDPYLVRSIDHHFCDVGVGEEGINRTISENVVGDFLEQSQPVGPRQGYGFLLIERPLEHLHHSQFQLGIAHLAVIQGGAESFDDAVMELASQVLVGVQDRAIWRRLYGLSRLNSICEAHFETFRSRILFVISNACALTRVLHLQCRPDRRPAGRPPEGHVRRETADITRRPVRLR